jgi:branched-chain amino acid transport system substrate-binding protein
VVGSVQAPLNTPDFSSFLLQAQASKAKVIGLANSGADTINAIKQAAEFGVGKSDQKLVTLLVYITDVKSLGLDAAQGLLLTEAFYWDMNHETRAWSRRYFDKMKRMPNMVQAGAYSSTPTISKRSRLPDCRVEHRDEDDESDADQRLLCL